MGDHRIGPPEPSEIADILEATLRPGILSYFTLPRRIRDLVTRLRAEEETMIEDMANSIKGSSDRLGGQQWKSVKNTVSKE